LFIAPSDYLKGQILKQVPLKTFTLPNFVAAPPSSLAPSGFSDFFLYASVLEAHKGILQLLKLFEENDWSKKLVIVGNGSLKEQIKQEIVQKGLEQKVVLLGGWMMRRFWVAAGRGSVGFAFDVARKQPSDCLEAYSVGTPVLGQIMVGA
jgi:glycosyltransferase involved in cell wall biosynthesis